jgi:hypothetical protein
LKTTSVKSAMGKQATRGQTILCFAVLLGVPSDTSRNAKLRFVYPQSADCQRRLFAD